MDHAKLLLGLPITWGVVLKECQIKKSWSLTIEGGIFFMFYLLEYPGNTFGGDYET